MSVSIAEVKRAVQALQTGQFRTSASARLPNPASRPDDATVVCVAGCLGQAGCTTVALAIASSAQSPARLVECCPGSRSGLAAAAQSELGEHHGWLVGARGEVRLERPATDSDRMPALLAATLPLTVLDLGLAAIPGWAAPGNATIVLVTRLSVPGLRRLEGKLAHLDEAAPLLLAVTGRPVARWPRSVRHAIGPRTQQLIDADRIVAVPGDPRLAMTGLTASPLTAALLKTGNQLLHLAKETST